tara:strand:+ start:231 stop:1658 length:1428 start_codon:yes stop_codon:yes gene_type:complete
MALKLNKLNDGLATLFNMKSVNAVDWARLIAKTIAEYASDLSPAPNYAVAMAPAQAAFITVLVAESGTLEKYLPRALKSGLPVFAATLAAGQLPNYTGVPPSSSPNFQGVMDSIRDNESTSNEAAAKLATAIHNWFCTGTATHTTTGAVLLWGVQGQATAGPEPDTVFSLSTAEFEAALGSLAQAKASVESIQKIIDTSLNPEEEEDEVYGKVTHVEVQGRYQDIVDTGVDSKTEYQAFNAIANTNEMFSSELGRRIVLVAMTDVGIQETIDVLDGKTTTMNYGGFKHPTDSTQNTTMPLAVYNFAKSGPGRIDEMHVNSGIKGNWNLANAGDEGNPREAYAWCASAVTTWFEEAGASHPKYYKGIPGRYDKPDPRNKAINAPASVKSWELWAKDNGTWSDTPQLGAAFISNEASHIGIISAIESNGQLWSIEGNTSGRGFNRNGGMCANKKVNKSGHLGYIIPRPAGTLGPYST